MHMGCSLLSKINNQTIIIKFIVANSEGLLETQVRVNNKHLDTLTMCCV